jgi:hypothetical protein
MSFEQWGGYRRRNDIDRTMLCGEGGKERRRQHDVAKKRCLDDEGRHGVRESYASLPGSATDAPDLA